MDSRFQQTRNTAQPDKGSFSDGSGFLYSDGGREAAGFRGSARDCATRSIAIATGRPYREVYDALNELAARERPRKGADRSDARTGVHIRTIRRYMGSIGWHWTPTMKIGSGCKVHLKAEELPAGRLVVSVSRHITALIDGVIHDTHDPRREDSYLIEPDRGQTLKEGQGRNSNGVWTRIGGRCVYGYWSSPLPRTAPHV